MSQQNAAKPPSKTLITGVVVFYLVAALAVHLLCFYSGPRRLSFFLFTQLLIAAILFIFSCCFCHRRTLLTVVSDSPFSFSNYTLRYVNESLYQVARGLVLPFTVPTSFIALHARPSLQILFACAIVIMGFFVGVFLDGHLSLASGIAATHSVVIKQSLKVVNENIPLLSWYTNSVSSIVLIPIILIAGEGKEVLKLFFAHLSKFAWGSFITGALGFMMSIASLLSISVAASLLGKWLFQDVIMSERASSIGIILGGSIYYPWVKHAETEARKANAEGGRNTNSKPE
ncbi:hypothetical protein L218DRAFT_975945 [Marasmius fiardii PR-910]|nr:hypothetical protein L218DRAFT_975945 [Marasmius fiardii PR-910]